MESLLEFTSIKSADSLSSYFLKIPHKLGAELFLDESSNSRLLLPAISGVSDQQFLSPSMKDTDIEAIETTEERQADHDVAGVEVNNLPTFTELWGKPNQKVAE